MQSVELYIEQKNLAGLSLLQSNRDISLNMYLESKKIEEEQTIIWLNNKRMDNM